MIFKGTGRHINSRFVPFLHRFLSHTGKKTDIYAGFPLICKEIEINVRVLSMKK